MPGQEGLGLLGGFGRDGPEASVHPHRLAEDPANALFIFTDEDAPALLFALARPGFQRVIHRWQNPLRQTERIINPRIASVKRRKRSAPADFP
jgi:hypothetical protein